MFPVGVGLHKGCPLSPNGEQLLSSFFPHSSISHTYHLFPQVKGYRYLEEDNSDESDSERSEDEGEKEDEEHVVEEMGAEEREEGGQDAEAQGADSPGARRRGAEGHRLRREDAHVKEGEREEHE